MATPKLPPPPKLKMVGWKYVVSLTVAPLVNVLTFFFGMLWLFGPAAVGITATLYASNSPLLSHLPSWLVFSGATAVSAPASPIFGVFGILMAWAIGTAGAIFYNFWFPLIGFSPLDTQNGRWWKIFLSTLGADVPLLDTFPFFSWGIISFVRAEHKKELEAYREWEKKNAEALANQDQMRLLEAMSFISAKQEERALAEQAANDNEEIPELTEQAA